MSGMLCLCATPIGNMKDVTFRVIETLSAVDLIACEDTRMSRKLLSRYDIHTPLTAYHKNNRYDKARELVALLKEGKQIALITDAGTPVLSDPGEELVRMCMEEGITVTSLPGPCALITALTLSGISAKRFCFEGFLPPARGAKKERTKRIKQLVREPRTVLMYEAPHHLKETLSDLREAFGDARRIVLCRELTKRFEEAVPMTLKEACSRYEKEEPRGEFVLVIEGYEIPDSTRDGVAIENMLALHADSAPAVSSYNGDLRIADLDGEEALKLLLLQLDIPTHVAFYEARGADKKEAMKKAAKDRNVTKREIYAACLADQGRLW